MPYDDFKSYIQDKYCGIIIDAIQEFVEKNRNRTEIQDLNALSTMKQIVENIEVKSLRCRQENHNNMICVEAGITANIVEMSQYSESIEASSKMRFFTVYMTAELHQGLHNTTVIKTQENCDGKFEPISTLDEYLIPDINSDDLEDFADDFFERYCRDAIFDRCQLPVEYIMRHMDIQMVESSLPDNVFGRIYFKPALIKYLKGFPSFSNEELEKEVSSGTMVINRKHCFMEEYGSVYNTIAHELVHWDLHQKFFEILSLLDENATQLSCEVIPKIPNDSMSGIQKAIWWAEWQANNLAPRISMPRQLFQDVFYQCYSEICLSTPVMYRGEYFEKALENTAALFGVSKYEAKVRAEQLGIMEAEGTLLYCNNDYFFPISFSKTALRKNQTFAIDDKSYKQLMETDAEFAKLINQGLYVYAECFVVRNDSLYVNMLDDPYKDGKFELTYYARENADECCMKFERFYRSDGENDFEYYGQCYLSKELTKNFLVEVKRTMDISEQRPEEKVKVIMELKKEVDRLTKIIHGLPTSFSGTFDKHMKRIKQDNGKKMTNLEMSKRTGLTEEYIRQLRHQELNVSLGTVCALCVGLSLPPCFSSDMLRKAAVDFPHNESGYLQSILLYQYYMEPLASINAILKLEQISLWGKNIDEEEYEDLKKAALHIRDDY